jgi:cyclic beta-1,2-glucan synthetase
VRTRYSDDLLWLPYALCEYIEKTGDEAILERMGPYLKSQPLGKRNGSAMKQPRPHKRRKAFWSMLCARRNW